jgi:VanZ family protein
VSRRLLVLLTLLLVGSLLLFAQLPIPPTQAGRTIENAGHVPLFLMVTLSVLFVLRERTHFAGWRLYALAGLAGIGAGFLSEVIQRPLRRDASWEDVLADAVGAICGLAVYALFDRRSGLQRWHRIVAVMVAITCVAIYIAPIVTMTRAYLHRNGQFPVLANFQSRMEMFWTRNIGVRRDIVNGALEVHFVIDETPGVSFYEPVQDWSAYEILVVDVENADDQPLNLGVRVHDLGHNWTFNDRYNRTFPLAGRERRTLRMSLDDIRHGPKNRLMDMTRISDITLFRDGKTGSRELRIHAMRLE